MSYLATLKRDGTDYVRPDGCHYDSAVDALGSVLGFCGCGAPEAALRYVRSALRCLNPPTWKDYDAWRARADAVFRGDEGAEYVMWYLLSDKNLTEHGGGVPGWLTELGKGVLVDLETLNLDKD